MKMEDPLDYGVAGMSGDFKARNYLRMATK